MNEYDPTIVHCNSCQYEGKAKVSGAGAFAILIGIFIVSLLFLPLIIVALIYMASMIQQPATRSCPTCKSKDLTSLSEYQQNKINEVDGSQPSKSSVI